MLSAFVLRAVAQRISRVTAGNVSYNLKTLDSNEHYLPTRRSVPRYRKTFFDCRTLYIDRASSNNTNMTLDDLSDAQLYAKLVEHGYPACPVTPTTRKVLLKKLEELAGSRKRSREKSYETSASDHKRENSPKRTPNLQTSFASTLNLPNSPEGTSNLRNSPESASDLQNSPASSLNLQNSPPSTLSEQKSPASTPNLQKFPASIPNPQKSPASTPNLQKLPTSTSNLQKIPASTPNLQKSAASTPNLQKSPASTPNVQKSPASTPNLQNSLTGTADVQCWLASMPNFVHQPQLLFFDLETSGLEEDCDILQISVRFGPSTFNRYADPTKPIAKEASNVNHLYNRDGLLYRDDQLLASQPLSFVLQELHEYLQTFGKKCILVAHNCPFDATRLLNAVQRHSVVADYAAVIDGFADTLQLFRKKYPKRCWQKGALTLTTLVGESLDLPTEGAHDAHYDTFLLEQLTFVHFTPQQLLNDRVSFRRTLAKLKN